MQGADGIVWNLGNAYSVTYRRSKGVEMFDSHQPPQMDAEVYKICAAICDITTTL